MNLFHSLNEEGRTIVFVTHDRKLGEECQRMVTISDGRIESDAV